MPHTHKHITYAKSIILAYMQIIINTCDSSILYLTITMRTAHPKVQNVQLEISYVVYEPRLLIK